MVNDKADDPVEVVKRILAGGPIPAPEFRRLAHEMGIPVKMIPAAAEAAGAKCRRIGVAFERRGNGGWVWELTGPPDQGIITKGNRKGYYANFFFHGKQVREKLGNDLETARARMAELRKELEAERAAEPPRPSRPAAPRVVKPAHQLLRELTRQLLRLCNRVERLEGAKATKNGVLP